MDNDNDNEVNPADFEGIISPVGRAVNALLGELRPDQVRDHVTILVDPETDEVTIELGPALDWS